MTQLAEIKQAVFARRNGVVAASLRRAADPHAIVLGVTLAELSEIAKDLPHNASIARALWGERNHRECRLLAPMLMPPEECTPGQPLEWALDVLGEEEADILCHRLLRRLPDATLLVDSLLLHPEYLPRYTALRLILNLIATGSLSTPLTFDLSSLSSDLQLQPLLRQIEEDSN